MLTYAHSMLTLSGKMPKTLMTATEGNLGLGVELQVFRLPFDSLNFHTVYYLINYIFKDVIIQMIKI